MDGGGGGWRAIWMEQRVKKLCSLLLFLKTALVVKTTCSVEEEKVPQLYPPDP